MRLRHFDGRFPYEYGSDLHWFWGWAARINAKLEAGKPVSDLEPMIFRPDRLAADAMTRLAIDYPLAVKPVQDWLSRTEHQFERFRMDPSEANAEDLCSAMHLLSERIVTTSAAIAAAQAKADKPKSRRAGISKEEANIRARAYLAEHAPKRQVSARELAEAIGCAVGLVPKLPAWIAYQEGLKAHAPAAAPRAVSLTEGVLCNEGREDEELQRLIEEQEAEARADLRQPRTRRRPRV